MAVSVLAVLSTALVIQGCTGKVSYAGYSVVESEPRSSEDVEMLERVSSCSVLGEWVGTGVGFLCSREQATILRREAKKNGIKTKFSTRHLGRKIEEEEKDGTSRCNLKKAGRILHHNEYVSAESIGRFVDELGRHNENVNVSRIGRSVQGRDIQVVVVNGGKNHPKIFIDAGIHAREWISPASTLFFLEKLTRVINRRGGRSATKQFEWHVLPLANPDGYEYSRNTDRMWRKNMRENSGSSCDGVDLNRNFPEGYGIGASSKPCSEVYQGPTPLSEPETQAIHDYIENTQGIRAAVSVHSYGNVLIFPWGYTQTPHPNKADLSKLAGQISKEVQEKTGEVYTTGTAREVFGAWGQAGGATDDYYITKGIPYSFTFELPEEDKEGKHGFLIPPSSIKKVGNQLYVGLTSLASLLE